MLTSRRRFSHSTGRACKHGRDGRPARARRPAGDPPELAGPPADPGVPRSRHKLLGWVPRPLRHGITLFVLLVFVEYVAVPSFLHSKARSSLSQLSRVNPAWLLAGFASKRPPWSPTAASRSQFSRGRARALQGAPDRPLHPGGEPRDPGGTAGAPGSAIAFSPPTELPGPTPVSPSPHRASARPSCSTPCSGWLLSSPSPCTASTAHMSPWPSSAPCCWPHSAPCPRPDAGEAHATRALRSLARRVPRVTEEQMERLVQRLANRLRTLGSDRHLLEKPSPGPLRTGCSTQHRFWAFVAAYGHVSEPIDLFVLRRGQRAGGGASHPGRPRDRRGRGGNLPYGLRGSRGRRLARRDLLAAVQLLAPHTCRRRGLPVTPVRRGPAQRAPRRPRRHDKAEPPSIPLNRRAPAGQARPASSEPRPCISSGPSAPPQG